MLMRITSGRLPDLLFLAANSHVIIVLSNRVRAMVGKVRVHALSVPTNFLKENNGRKKKKRFPLTPCRAKDDRSIDRVDFDLI